MAIPAPVEDNHAAFRAVVMQKLAFYRKKLLIPPRWHIDIVVLCPEEMTANYGIEGVRATAAWEYCPNAMFRMRVRCDLTPDMLDWVIPHELLEMLMSWYGDFCDTLINRAYRSTAVKREVVSRHKEIRDEIIEWFLDILIPEHRMKVDEGV